MKRVISVAMVLMLLLGLCACGEKDPNLGKYVMTESLFLEEAEELNGEWLELKSGGKGTLYTYGIESEITWSLDGTAFTLNEFGYDYTGTLKDGVIAVEYNGSQCTFVKEK